MSYLRSLIVLGAGAALLPSCGGNDGFSPASGSTAAIRVSKGSQTFTFTGTPQTVIVPAGVEHVTITATGASGAPCSSGCRGYGTPGNGGYVKATIPVTAGQKLHVFVGGSDGWNGGGGGGSSGALRGGGASDVRQGGKALRDRVVVAGGGGAGGLIIYWPSLGNGGFRGPGGGRAGGGAGGSGYGDDPGGGGGVGGRQTHGGAGGAGGVYKAMKPLCHERGYCNGAAGSAGTLALGGTAANTCGGPGGGGGGGYYGGGGGGSGSGSYLNVSAESGGGGGGGSSFVASTSSRVKEEKGGAAPGNGQVIIAWP